MDMHAILALAGATAVLVAIPGPNVALIVARTLAHGLRAGVATVLGTTLGVAAQLGVVVLGFAALIEGAATALIWLKWAGVVYLVWLGVTVWRRGTAGPPLVEAAARPSTRMVAQAAALAAVNPKTLLFNAAFLPQFLPDAPDRAAPWVAAGVYLAVIFLGDLGWAASARSARPAMLRLGRLRHRLTGGLFIGAGLALAAARIDR